MPKFTQISKDKLATCHPDLQTLFNEIIIYYDCTILEGYRNQVNQEKAFNSGHSKLHYPNSKHNTQPCMAVDAISYPINFDNENLSLWFGGYVVGIAQSLKSKGLMSYTIRWGGSWNGLGKLNSPEMFNDLDHFELV